MKWFCFAPLLLITLAPMASAEKTAEKTLSPADQALPSVQAAIPNSIKNLVLPTPTAFAVGITMAVSTSSEKAQQHVIQGLNHLHGGWEFEASRHFAAAMREDPDCLLAHWGMLMSLLDASPETIDTRRAALQRMVYLMQAGSGTELERGYVEGILRYFKDGPNGASEAFSAIAENYPNDLQACIFAALFKRGGYDDSGSATPDQITSENRLLNLMQRFPDSSPPINALLVIHGEAPDVSDALKLARKLCKMQPSYPPAFHLLGHYEWRSGNHKHAAAAFGRASMLYQKWMRHNKVGIADCPEWIKTECYRVVALLSMGDDETAYAAAAQIATTPIPEDRKASPGVRLLLWDAKTLPARILIRRGLSGNAPLAAMKLPKPDEIVPYHKDSLAYLWIDGLRITLEAQRLIDADNLDEARQLITLLENQITILADARQSAWVCGESAQWTRAYRALRVLHADVRGMLTLAGPADTRNTAYNWYASAIDHQRYSPMLYAPLILTPMTARLGEFFLKLEKPADAIEQYQRALKVFPNDIQSLIGLRTAYIAAGDTQKAADVGVQISQLKEN